MPRLSTLSNPTGLVDLERQRVGIALDETSGRLAFSLVKLDLSGLSLPLPLNVVVITRRGNSEERVELGSVADWKKGFQLLHDIGVDGTWVFRVLLVQADSPRLVAVAENVRPEGQGDSSSFIALEPADLGQRLWDIVVLEAEGRAVIRFHRDIYPSAGAAEADSFFMGMILPEAIRRVAEFAATDPAVLVEEWAPFKDWLVIHGITDEPGQTDGERVEWCSEVVATFCNRFEFVNKLKEQRNEGAAE